MTLTASRRAFVGGAVAAMGLRPAPAQAGPFPSRSLLPWASGCATDELLPTAFEQYRGRPVDVRTLFWQRASWAGMEKLDGLRNKLYPRGSLNKEATVITYYLFPDQESPKTGGAVIWQNAVSGMYDARHRKIAAAIALRQGPFIFRLGHEWNGTSFSWGVIEPSQADLYKNYFCRTVDIIREEMLKQGQVCLFDWCSLKRGQAKVSIDYFYPGDDYVDFIGHDRYDRFPSFKTQADWDKRYNETQYGGPVGMGQWLLYAKSKGKKLSFPEWGTSAVTAGGLGDNPFFIEKMLKFFSANAADIGFECYFNRRAGQGGHNLTDNPLSGAKYLQLMTSGGV